jgi:hypothetical protein
MQSDAPHFVPLANYPDGFQADLARQRLEDHGVLVLIKSRNGGILGAGYYGPVAGGVDLLVPSPELDRARALLEF